MESPEDDDEDDDGRRRLRILANDQEVCYSSSAVVCVHCHHWTVVEAWYVTTMINLVRLLLLRILEDEPVQSRPWMPFLW